MRMGQATSRAHTFRLLRPIALSTALNLLFCDASSWIFSRAARKVHAVMYYLGAVQHIEISNASLVPGDRTAKRIGAARSTDPLRPVSLVPGDRTAKRVGAARSTDPLRPVHPCTVSIHRQAHALHEAAPA